jgi:hypothetical protein
MDTALLGFLVYLLGGGNPANFWSTVVTNGQAGCLPKWAVLKIGAAIMAYVEISAGVARSSLAWSSLAAWAAVESLSTGSHQRVPCPITGLVGSGRWGARDGGGHYRILRDVVAGYLVLGPAQVGYERLGLVLQAQGRLPNQPRLEDLATKVAQANYDHAVEEYRQAKRGIADSLDHVGMDLSEDGQVVVEPSEVEDLTMEEKAAFEAATPEQIGLVRAALEAIERWSRRKNLSRF